MGETLDLFATKRWSNPFHDRYNAGKPAEARVNGKTRGGRVCGDSFLAFAPGPLEVPLDQVTDLRIHDEQDP